MRKNLAFDTVRFIILSPELLAIAAASILCHIYDEYARDAISYFPWDAPNLIIAFLGFPVALVAAAFKFGTDLLSKNRKLLLDAKLYRHCKNRVIFSCALTSASFGGTVIAFILIRKNDPLLIIYAAALISSGWISSMISVASLAIADFTIKEIEDSH